MIVRPDGDDLLLITQPDHARLALAIAEAWAPAGLAGRPRRESIRLAAREHDNGWREEDAAPQIDAAGRPVDFVGASLDVKLRVWTRGIDRLAVTDAYAAALVALHALTVYDQRRPDADWTAFFGAMAERHDALLRQSGVDAAAAQDDYHVVNVADALSLAFCTNAAPPRPIAGHAVALEGAALYVTPDSLTVPVPLRVLVRRLPDRPYASPADLRAAIDAAAPAWLTGTLLGRDAPPKTESDPER